ncbi:methyltransferase-like protein 25B isoform X2 [Colletes latitarsis]|uniref:methyltransferase-like protein 25B isoform X2 n=1 Tax=Colletes latitarsis TaxID=2605962 RepID=UPI0040366B2B
MMACVSERVQNKYFSDALNLFAETQWLYNTPVTDLLAKGLLDFLPTDWLNVLQILEIQELNNMVVKKTTKPQWPETLKAFVKKCKNLNRLPLINTVLSTTLPKNFQIGLNDKKQHEIMHLAHLVHKQCAPHDINVIIDFGAGLGYVCQLLYHLYGYKVLGLEKNQANVNKARDRQVKMYPDSLEYVKYNCCDLTCDSVEIIETILRTEFQENSDVCLIGLHACGDLSIHASKIFLNMKAAQIFIMISCCYHKLSISKSIQINASTEKQYFNNFPLSNCLKSVILNTDFDIGLFLRQPFLRLACQEPADRWNNMSAETHNQHSFYVLARAVLQLYATENIQSDLDIHEKNIIELWKNHYNKLKVVEIYTALQLMLQSAAESLILQDWLCWMHERGLDATIIPVMNKQLSPRSYAIVSWKR